jgi:predicted histone-like DNA-binding protein
VTLDEIAAEAYRNSGFSEGSVIGVATEIQDIMKEKLRDGQTVVLPGIGRFSLRVESIGVDDPKDFNIRHHITRIICGFLPAGRRIQGRHILYDLCDGVKAVWQKGFKP